MSEVIIPIDIVQPGGIFRCERCELDIIRKNSPELKLVAVATRSRSSALEEHPPLQRKRSTSRSSTTRRSGSLTPDNVLHFLGDRDGAAPPPSPQTADVPSLARTDSWSAPVRLTRNEWWSRRKNDVVFAIGPAGTGKTYTAVALAVRALKNRRSSVSSSPPVRR